MARRRCGMARGSVLTVDLDESLQHDVRSVLHGYANQGWYVHELGLGRD